MVLGVIAWGTCFAHCFISAKFDPPKIQRIEAVPKRNGCLRLSWSLSQHQAWMCDYRLNLEVRLKSADSNQWNKQPVSTNQSSLDINYKLCLLTLDTIAAQ